MQEEYLIATRITDLESKAAHMRQHILQCHNRRDWHGVMDASADLREIESALASLKWVLMEGEGFI